MSEINGSEKDEEKRGRNGKEKHREIKRSDRQ